MSQHLSIVRVCIQDAIEQTRNALKAGHYANDEDKGGLEESIQRLEAVHDRVLEIQRARL